MSDIIYDSDEDDKTFICQVCESKNYGGIYCNLSGYTELCSSCYDKEYSKIKCQGCNKQQVKNNNWTKPSWQTWIDDHTVYTCYSCYLKYSGETDEDFDSKTLVHKSDYIY